MDVVNPTQTIFPSFISIWNSIISWFDSIINKSGMYGIILGIVIAMLALRFIVYPAFKPGVGRSDTVKKSKKRNKNG